MELIFIGLFIAWICGATGKAWTHSSDGFRPDK